MTNIHFQISEQIKTLNDPVMKLSVNNQPLKYITWIIFNTLKRTSIMEAPHKK